MILKMQSMGYNIFLEGTHICSSTHEILKFYCEIEGFEKYKSKDHVENLHVRTYHKEEKTREGKGMALTICKIVL